MRASRSALGATAGDGRATTEFAASGKTILFPGFLRAYVEGSDDPEAALEDQERVLPDLSEGDGLTVEALEANGHETQPPARFTEASLVRRLEELGVGRPSTYASIISTIQDRGYVWKKGSALVPAFTAFAVVTLLEEHFPDLVDYAFTASHGGRPRRDRRRRSRRPFPGSPASTSARVDPAPPTERPTDPARPLRASGSAPAACTPSSRRGSGRSTPGPSTRSRSGPTPTGRSSWPGSVSTARTSKRGEDTASIPEDVPPDELTTERAVEFLEAPSGDRELGEDPETGLPVLLRNGRFGPYVQLG